MWQKRNKEAFQVCPDGYCHSNGRKKECICENHKSRNLAAITILKSKITSPTSNIFHVVIQAQQNATCEVGLENVSGLVSGIASWAFLRGNLNSLTIAGLVNKYI